MRQLQTILFPSILRYQRMLMTASLLSVTASAGIDKKVLSEDRPWPGFVRRKETWWLSGLALGENNPPVDMEAYYSEIDGSYIGDENVVKTLREYGIAPQRNRDDHSVASIGWSEQDQKWYGWSHRAIYGFGIGDEFYQPDTCFGDGGQKPKRTITNMDEARQSACNFAEDMS